MTSNFITVFYRSTALVGLRPLIFDVSRSHQETPKSVGLLWTSDRPVAETPTWQDTTLTRDRHPAPARFEPAIPATQRPQTHALDRMVNGIGALHSFSRSLIPWSRILLRKLTNCQVVKKFPAFYGTRRFITAFTRDRHLSRSWTSSIKSMPPHPTSWGAILILPSHPRLCLLSGLFLWGFRIKTLYTPLLSPICTICPAHLILFYLIPNNVGWGVQIIKLLIM